MNRKLFPRGGLLAAILAAGLLLLVVRPAALGSAPQQATATPGLPTRPGLTVSPTAAPTLPVTPTVVVPPTATPLPPTARPTREPTDEPPTAIPTPPPTPEPTPPPPALPQAGVARPAWPWVVLAAGLALLVGTLLVRRR